MRTMLNVPRAHAIGVSADSVVYESKMGNACLPVNTMEQPRLSSNNPASSACGSVEGIVMTPLTPSGSPPGQGNFSVKMYALSLTISIPTMTSGFFMWTGTFSVSKIASPTVSFNCVELYLPVFVMRRACTLKEENCLGKSWNAVLMIASISMGT